MNHKPLEGMRIYKSIAGAADMYWMSWTVNYMLVWQQNNEEMITELQISLLTDFIHHCTQNNKVMWTNKHVENPNTNRLPRTLCINSRGQCLEWLALLQNLQSLHSLMYKFGNSSPHSYLKNSVTYRGEKKKSTEHKISFFFSVFAWNYLSPTNWVQDVTQTMSRWYSPSSHTFGE
jgi:hypothetical protein